MLFKSKTTESWTCCNKFNENLPNYKEVIEVLKFWNKAVSERRHNLTIENIK